jgi:PAS domain S-box-containing protein
MATGEIEKARILIVEDESIIARDIEESLTSLGFEVVSLEVSGEKAVERASREKPDLVLMDIVLQGPLDGIEAATEIRSRLGIPVIYLTAYTDSKVMERAKVTEPFGYLIKPFDNRELSFAIEMALYKHKTELELRESRHRYRELVETAGAIPWELDLATNKFTYVGPQAEKVLGYPGEDWVDIDFWAGLLHPKDGWAKDRCMSAVARGEDHELEYRAIASDGRTVWLRDIVNIVRADGKPVKLRGFMLDITTRKKAEESLTLYSEAVEAAPDGIQVVDMEGGIIYSNRAVEKIYGFSPEELRGRHVNEMNADPLFAGEVIIPAIKKNGGWTGELVVRHKEGREFPVWLATSLVTDPNGKPVAMIGVSRDITEKNRAEAEREKLIAELRDALDSIKTLKGLLPMCAWCKKIRDDSGYWQQVELYIQRHSDASFTHGMCPECRKQMEKELEDSQGKGKG